MAEKAKALGLGKDEALIVEGRYGHVNFLSAPDPLQIKVVDLIPPLPSRLLDLARAAVSQQDFPPVVFHADHIDVSHLAFAHRAESHMFPCRAGGLVGPGTTYYLDERPAKQKGLLVGCERTEQIYRHFYGEAPRRIETCPQKLLSETSDLVLTRCCALQNDILVVGRRAVVPWGCDKGHVFRALELLVHTTPPASP